MIIFVAKIIGANYVVFNVYEKMKRLLFIMVCLCSLYVSAANNNSTVPYLLPPWYSYELRSLWQVVPQLIEKGDTTNAMREMHRIEKLCKKKYKSPLSHYEWLSIKAKIYANCLNDLENACNIQFEACGVLPYKTKYEREKCSAFIDAHIYEYQLGELDLAYKSAFLAYGIANISENAKSLRPITTQYLIKSCISLEKYKDALSIANVWKKNASENYHSYYDNLSEKGGSWGGYSSALSNLVDATNAVIDCNLKLGYLYNAEEELTLLDSIVQSHNNRVIDSSDSIFKYSVHDFSYHSRVKLLISKGELDKATELLQNTSLEPCIIDWYADEVKYNGESLLKKAELYYERMQYDEAIQYYIEAGDEFFFVNQHHPNIADILHKIVSCEKQNQGGYTENTLNALAMAYDILLNSNNEGTLLFAKTLQLSIENDLELNSGSLTKHLWSKWVMKTSLIYLKYLQEQFTKSTSNERLHIWNNGPYKDWFENMLPRLVCENSDLAGNDSIINCAYHGVQITKNIQLHSERRINEMIAESEDENLKEKYEKYRSLRKDLLNCYEEGKIENTDNLCKEISELENYILRKLSLSDDLDYKDAWAINNSYVDSIQVGDVYVDFVRYTSSRSLTTYGAMVAMNHNDRPVVLCVDLFTEEKLDSISKENYHTSNAIYELVWGKLSMLFKNVEAKNIYFAPIGDLHKIAIENVPDEYGISIGDKYNVYRVTSTKEAIMYSPNKTSSSGVKMLMFGGMDYESDEIVIKRDAIGLLPFTRFEVDDIYHSLPDDIYCTKYVGKSATESCLKSINTSEIDILHISAHGFYWDKSLKYGADDPISIHVGKRRGDFTVEDMNMARSALLFSPEKKESKEDGILFANEVSEMNFINLDLVTLSACKTAMGDLSSEGLVGLQRGFKKAGANSLLVSLDIVSDHATYLLMSEFYKHLFAGCSKRESLQRAQYYVKTYNNGMYKHPRYWTPFILIDGLD